MKLHENTSGGSRAVPYGQTDTHDDAVSFRNFAKASKMILLFLLYLEQSNWSEVHAG